MTLLYIKTNYIFCSFPYHPSPDSVLVCQFLFRIARNHGTDTITTLLLLAYFPGLKGATKESKPTKIWKESCFFFLQHFSNLNSFCYSDVLQNLAWPSIHSVFFLAEIGDRWWPHCLLSKSKRSHSAGLVNIPVWICSECLIAMISLSVPQCCLGIAE